MKENIKAYFEFLWNSHLLKEYAKTFLEAFAEIFSEIDR